MQTDIDNDIDNALGEVARASGRDLRVVWRVYGLMMAVHNYGHVLMMLDGKLTDVVDGDMELLPSSLRADIEGSWYDVVQLLPPINRALHRVVDMNPTVRAAFADRLTRLTTKVISIKEARAARDGSC